MKITPPIIDAANVVVYLVRAQRPGNVELQSARRGEDTPKIQWSRPGAIPIKLADSKTHHCISFLNSASV
jgi:hypothetical protein